MGHDLHFLKRLPERADAAEMDLALTLYRDAELVKALLVDAKVPAAGRAAIALGEAKTGPFVVVEPSGGFVTLLAADMRHELPVVARERLVYLAERRVELQERLAVARRRGRGGDGLEILGRLRTRGHLVSREDILAASAWAPMLQGELLHGVGTAAGTVGDARRVRFREWLKTRAAPTDAMRCIWEQTWAIGHYAVLAVDAPLPPAVFEPEVELQMLLGWSTVRQGVLGVVVRGLWALSRTGKPMLPLLKGMLATPADRWSWRRVALVGFGLAALAAGHAKLEAEATKALRRLPSHMPDKALAALATTIVRMTERPPPGRAVESTALELGAEIVCNLGGELPPGHPWRFDEPADVPDDLALVAPLHLARPLVDTQCLWLLWLGAMLPRLVRLPAPQLYLPAGALAAWPLDWTPENTRFLADEWQWDRVRQAPVVAAPTPGRNDPCACGSGKKFKRCCVA